MLEDNGRCENPLLPSPKELVPVDIRLSKHRISDLQNALMKRVEQGVPLETLDLRTCHRYLEYPAVRILSEIVVNVLDPEETIDATEQIISMWDRLARGPFVGHDNTEDANRLDDEDEDEDE